MTTLKGKMFSTASSLFVNQTRKFDVPRLSRQMNLQSNLRPRTPRTMKPRATPDELLYLGPKGASALHHACSEQGKDAHKR